MLISLQGRIFDMKLDLNIGISQKQGLNLTAQVQQAIKLLQMTNLELTEYIEENFIPNPFVELKDTTSSKQKNSNEKILMEKKSSADLIESTPFAAEPSKPKTEVENQFETGESYTPKSTVAKEQNDFDPVQLLKSQDKSARLDEHGACWRSHNPPPGTIFQNNILILFCFR